MKRFIFILTVVLNSISLLSQELRYSDLTPDANGRHQYRGERLITAYVSRDGTVYRVGEKIQIGRPSSNKTFAFITNQEGVGMSILSAIGGQESEIRPLEATASNSETVIKTICIIGNKRTGYYATIQTKGIMGSLPTIYDIQVENAIQFGEIKSSGMTSDDALTELKKSKDKLDLGIISQEKYDSLKAVLVKYIK